MGEQRQVIRVHGWEMHQWKANDPDPADDDPFVPLEGLADLGGTVGWLDGADGPRGHGDLQVEFSTHRCMIGRHGHQVLHAVQIVAASSWAESGIELVLTLGRYEPFVGLYQVHYDHDYRITASSGVRLRGGDAGWVAGLVTQLPNFIPTPPRPRPRLVEDLKDPRPGTW